MFDLDNKVQTEQIEFVHQYRFDNEHWISDDRFLTLKMAKVCEGSTISTLNRQKESGLLHGVKSIESRILKVRTVKTVTCETITQK